VTGDHLLQGRATARFAKRPPDVRGTTGWRVDTGSWQQATPRRAPRGQAPDRQTAAPVALFPCRPIGRLHDCSELRQFA